MKTWKHGNHLYRVYEGSEIQPILETTEDMGRYIIVQIQYPDGIKMKYSGQVRQTKHKWAICDSAHHHTFELKDVLRVYVKQVLPLASVVKGKGKVR